MGEKRAYKPRKPGGGRKKLKPEYDAGKNLKEQMESAVVLYNSAMSLQAIADALVLNPIKVRKLLITAGVYESKVAEKVQDTFAEYRETQSYREEIVQILQAGMLAPSSKNRQPWKFVVAAESAKAEACQAMEEGIRREKKEPFIPDSSPYINGAEHTLRIMQQAPVLIFIVNTLAAPFDKELSMDERVSEICNAQSIGAAIENMTLEAAAQGLGSLWICDSFFAQKELSAWAGGEMYAVLAVGYADEAPATRPRKKAEDVVEWRG